MIRCDQYGPTPPPLCAKNTT
jgi:hypothetical protein